MNPKFFTAFYIFVLPIKRDVGHAQHSNIFFLWSKTVLTGTKQSFFVIMETNAKNWHTNHLLLLEASLHYKFRNVFDNCAECQSLNFIHIKNCGNFLLRNITIFSTAQYEHLHISFNYGINAHFYLLFNSN